MERLALAAELWANGIRAEATDGTAPRNSISTQDREAPDSWSVDGALLSAASGCGSRLGKAARRETCQGKRLWTYSEECCEEVGEHA